ncbi:hypothetical protein MLD52_01600 [Puniceicoccaceae bacterium K14]|nr:hypothetical protein [Puniceicoccaceae bacterium K14]
MKLWKNTSTLDSLCDSILNTAEPSIADIALIGGKKIDLSTLPNLKGIFKCGVGTDNVPFEECEKRGIEVGLPSADTAEIIFEETATFTVSMIFRMLYSEVGSIDSWRKMQRTIAAKKSVLIVGLGNIGRRVAGKLEGSVNVLHFDHLQVENTSLEELMGQADVVSMHIPLTKDNRSFFDKEKLSWLKDGAAIVNTARGAIVDEEALFLEIQSGRLRAAFDVFWEEPYKGKLVQFADDRFFMTPHVASTSRQFLEGLLKDFKEFAKKVC